MTKRMFWKSFLWPRAYVMNRAKFPSRSCQRERNNKTHFLSKLRTLNGNYSNKYSCYPIYNRPQNTGTLSYHEGQGGEEEAHDQFDIRSMTHHQLQALTEGNGLRLQSHSLWNPTTEVENRRTTVRFPAPTVPNISRKKIFAMKNPKQKIMSETIPSIHFLIFLFSFLIFGL